MKPLNQNKMPCKPLKYIKPEKQMKATLKFNLPEDREDFNHANNGFNYYMALVEMDQWLRSEYKYNGKEEMYEVRNRLREIISENNVKLD